MPDLSQVVAPPYDMISEREQDLLYRRHPRNVVRLILGRENEGDPSSNRYDRAADYYRKWRAEGVLVRDPKPAIYVYCQDYELGGERYRRIGLIARVGLEEFGGGAYPHEATLSGPKEDRLKLLMSCRVNFSPVFSLYSDDGGRVESRLEEEISSPPLVDFEDDKGVTNRLWRIEERAVQEWIAGEMREKTFIIADGHHRYETALEFRRLMRRNPAAFRETHDHIMMCLARKESPGLKVLPFHRLLIVDDPGAILERLRMAFEVEERPLPVSPERFSEDVLKPLAAGPGRTHRFAVYLGGSTVHFLRLREGIDTGSFTQRGTSPLVAELDVTILHKVVLQGVLGLDEPRLVQEGKMEFLSKPEEAVQAVRAGEFSAGFFLSPILVDQVWKIATSGQKMPQKSTNFYPKLLTGLVFNEL